MHPVAAFSGLLGVVLLWIAVLVPVRSLDDDQFDDVTSIVGSLTGDPAAIGHLLATTVAMMLLVVVRRFPDRGRTAIGLAATGLLATALVTLPGAGDVILWDGVDARGRPTGGLARMVPAAGMWIGVAGGLLVAASGVVACLLARTGGRTFG